MKKTYRYLVAALALCACVLLPGSALSAKAATYYLLYDKDKEDWRYSTEGYTEDVYTRELYYLYRSIANGDNVVVCGEGKSQSITLNVHLESLTYLGTDASLIIYTNGMDTCSIGNSARAAVHGAATNLYAYTDSAVTFCDPVENLYLLSDGGKDYTGDVNTPSTVGHMILRNGDHTVYDIYNVAKGKLDVVGGYLRTDPRYYFSAPTAQAQATGNNATTISLVRNGVDYTAVFNPVYYASAYGDLAAAYGNDQNALFNHFLTRGMKEGRRGNASFDVKVYRNRYADLNAAFGDDLPSYYLHYISYGFTEGRDAR